MENLNIAYCLFTIFIAINHCRFTSYEEYCQRNNLIVAKKLKVLNIIYITIWFLFSLFILLQITFY